MPGHIIRVSVPIATIAISSAAVFGLGWVALPLLAPAARAKPYSAHHTPGRVIVGGRRQAIAANHQLFLQLRLVGPVCSLLLRPRFLRLRWLRRNVTDRSDDNFALRARNFPWPIFSSLSGGLRRGWVQTVPGRRRSRQRCIAAVSRRSNPRARRRRIGRQ